jgi:cell division septation protein DedD
MKRISLPRILAVLLLLFPVGLLSLESTRLFQVQAAAAYATPTTASLSPTQPPTLAPTSAASPPPTQPPTLIPTRTAGPFRPPAKDELEHLPRPASTSMMIILAAVILVFVLLGMFWAGRPPRK